MHTVGRAVTGAGGWGWGESHFQLEVAVGVCEGGAGARIGPQSSGPWTPLQAALSLACLCLSPPPGDSVSPISLQTTYGKGKSMRQFVFSYSARDQRLSDLVWHFYL